MKHLLLLPLLLTLPFLLLASDSTLVDQGFFMETAPPRGKIKYWRYKGSDFAFSFGPSYAIDQFSHRNTTFAQDFTKAFSPQTGLSAAFEVEVPINKLFRTGFGLNYLRLVRDYSPPQQLVNNITGAAPQHIVQSINVPVYIALDKPLGSKVSLGLAGGFRLRIWQSAKGSSFSREYVAIDFDHASDPPYYRREPSFGLYGALRGEYRLTDFFSLIGRFTYFPAAGNELNLAAADGHLLSSSFQLRFGVNYALFCYR